MIYENNSIESVRELERQRLGEYEQEKDRLDSWDEVDRAFDNWRDENGML